jgi:ketosteroid isomerase-like protein
MSQENVEIVRAAIDAYNRGGWEAALKDAAPDFELDWSRAIGPLRGVYGREQVRPLGGRVR